MAEHRSVSQERADELWVEVQRHLGPHRVDIALEDTGVAVYEHPDGTVSFHLKDRSLTLVLNLEDDLLVRQLRHGQHVELTVHKDGEMLEGVSALGSHPQSN